MTRSCWIGAAFGMAGVFVGAAASWAAATPPTSKPAGGPQHASFATEDGIVIVGDYYPPATKSGEAAPIVILLPMYKSDRSAWARLVPDLHAAGFAVLAIDLRGHGESLEPKAFDLAGKVADRDPKLFRAMYKDVSAAYQWLADQENVDLARFALVGASVGCSVAIDYAGRDRSVDAIVCLSPGTNYLGLDSTSHLRKCADRTMLMIASKAESDATAQLARIGQHVTVRTAPDAPSDDRMAMHGTNLLGKVDGLDRTIVAFLVKALGPPSREPVVASVNSEVYHLPGSGHTQQIKEENLRWFSSAAEAESRGLRAVKKRSSESDASSSKANAPPKRSAR